VSDISSSAPCVDGDLIQKAQGVVLCLRSARITLVTAESCTAGLVSAVLSQVDGAGDILHGAFVTYSKANKSKALGVNASLLTRKGAVDDEVARQMACGALDKSPADVALAITGVLGPAPDEDNNPVGLVFFAVARRQHPAKTMRRDYGPQPHDVLRRASVIDGLDFLARTLC
jgi:nicotinamide-nucleotide amidase